jgi:NAD(P)-dependent dehydrogenase (short-subunit alcohol dehydrogenase family)
MLLVLDHFEHLVEARQDLVYLLQACPNLVILVTSRVRLGIAGEWVFKLGGLDAPPAGLDASLAAYSAAKAGIVALTRALAVEEREHGVRVNAIAPGMLDTLQNREKPSESARFVSREEVAEVVRFLVSRESRGISGETIQVMGETLR